MAQRATAKDSISGFHAGRISGFHPRRMINLKKKTISKESTHLIAAHFVELNQIPLIIYSSVFAYGVIMTSYSSFLIFFYRKFVYLLQMYITTEFNCCNP